MPDWRRNEAYAFTEGLNREQWSWEFLRRNPDYQREWRAFCKTWLALEADYGRAPNRDFCQWKLDPRAWVPAEACPEGDCRIDGDRVLIECAMGARWGFYKYPPDPADDDPVGSQRLVWREVPRATLLLEEGGPCPGRMQVTVCFDLSLPLREQIEQAKRTLQIEQRRRVKRGEVRLRTVRALGPRWRRYLRLLDALAEGASEADILERIYAGDREALEADRVVALRLRDGGYRELLLLPDH